MAIELITTEEFASLRPKRRGYVVYMMGARQDQPNVPDEANPYRKQSAAHRAWDEGQFLGVLQSQDDP